MTQALITPGVLKWARVRTNLTYERLAKSANTNTARIREWETGGSFPTLKQAQRLAQALRIPFAYLYLSNPPEERIPIPDRRLVAVDVFQRPSADFFEVLNAARRKQDWYRDYLVLQGAREISFVGAFATGTDPLEVAAHMRATLSAAGDLHAAADSWSKYLAVLSHAAEEVGVLVLRSGIVGNNTHRPLDIQEFRGFAISDSLAPLVFINAKDAQAAQIFTLAHELAHIWVGQSGVSDLSTDSRRVEIDNDVERFCNQVAAEFLVPSTVFRERWGASRSALGDRVQAFARTYRVSTTMILRRALELTLISRDQFLRQLEQERQHQRRQRTRVGGGNFRSSFMARNGRRLVGALFEAVLEGRALYRDGAAVLELKTSTFVRMADDLRLAQLSALQ